MSLPPVDQDPDAVRRAAQEILADPRYRPPPRNLLQRALDWLGSVLDRFFGALTGGGVGTGVVVIVLVVGLLIGLGLLVRAIVRRRHYPRPADRPPAPRATVIVDHTVEPRQWRAEADAAARAGRWREALRCRYRALVGDLARRGVLDEIPGRTTGEERTQLTRTAPEAAPPFAGASDLFDRAWYGAEATGAAEDERFQALEADVLLHAGDDRG